MKRLSLFLIVIVAALGVSGVVLAEDHAEDPKDNACYAGGAWEGKCDWPTDAEDEWAWTCGWYYARAIDGRISADQYPADCGEWVSLIFCFSGEIQYETLCIYSDDSYRVTLYPQDDAVLIQPIGKIGTFEDSDEGEEACDAAAYAFYVSVFGPTDDNFAWFADFDTLASLSNGSDGYQEDQRTFCVLSV